MMERGTISVQVKHGNYFYCGYSSEVNRNVISRTQVSERSKNLTGVNVLVQDNELNAEIAAVQLEEFGMNVERAVDGKNAVEIFEIIERHLMYPDGYHDA